MNSIGSAHADLFPRTRISVHVSTPDRMLFISGTYVRLLPTARKLHAFDDICLRQVLGSPCPGTLAKITPGYERRIPKSLNGFAR